MRRLPNDEIGIDYNTHWKSNLTASPEASPNEA
jgi:hypothetical protein